jgi:hypothetical protein
MFTEPSVAFPVPAFSDGRAALEAMTDGAIRHDLALPQDKSEILRASESLGLPLAWVLTGDIASLLHYARVGVTEKCAAA